jgi:hypothetical protein
MSGHSRLRGWSIEEHWPECYGETRRYRRIDTTYKLTLEFDCDAAFLAGLQLWLQQQDIEGAERIMPKARRLPSAQPRLPAAPIEGELLDDEPDE